MKPPELIVVVVGFVKLLPRATTPVVAVVDDDELLPVGNFVIPLPRSATLLLVAVVDDDKVPVPAAAAFVALVVGLEVKKLKLLPPSTVAVEEAAPFVVELQ